MPQEDDYPSTPTTASRHAALAWRRCTWTSPRATTHATARAHPDDHGQDRRATLRRMAPRTPAPAAHRHPGQARTTPAGCATASARTVAGRGQPPGSAALSRRACLSRPPQPADNQAMGEFDLIARYFTRPVRHAAWAWATTAPAGPAPRHATGHQQRHAGRRPPLCRCRPRGPGPQGPGRQPVGTWPPVGPSRWPSRWRWRCRESMKPGWLAFPKVCWRWPMRTAASWWAVTPRRAR